MDFLYNYIFLPLALIYVKIWKNFNIKLKARESEVFESWVNLNQLPEDCIRIWFHSASMGEFEQAKPVIELLKQKIPNVFIIASFFSPSGYNTQQNYKFVDRVCYIPLDLKKYAHEFIELINPNLAIFVRYEIWRNHLLELKKRNIPVYLINATKPTNNFFANFPITRQFIKSNMKLFDKIYTTGITHTKFFVSLGIKHSIRTLTDTRFDRIVEFVEDSMNNLILPKEIFDEDELILVAGSTWAKDEEIICEGVRNVEKSLEIPIKVIYVPHEPTEENIERLSLKLGNYALLSKIFECLKTKSCKWLNEKLTGRDIVVDSIGYLLRLYNYADFAYIGGAFGEGVHSVTEAAGYGLPLCAGPNLSKSTDAQILKKMGVLTSIYNRNDFEIWLKKHCINPTLRKETGRLAKEYIYQAAGSSKFIVRNIIQKLNEKQQFENN